MARILDVLEEFLREVEKSNPHGLIGKGGTILSLFYLGRHRESEDLDFDTMLGKSQYRKIEVYFISILERLKRKGFIRGFSIGKSGLAATNRYHMSITLETYKKFHTKIDVDFVKPVKSLEKKGELRYYTIERLFIGKLIAFAGRKEFKDIYDLSHMVNKLDLEIFKGNQNVIRLIDDAVKVIESEEVVLLYKKAFRNVDLRFKSLKEPKIGEFVAKLVRDLRMLRNRIS